MTGDFSNKSFLLILLLFLRNFFERSSTYFLGIQTCLQNTKNRSVFLLFVHFLLVVLQSLYVLMLPTFSYFSTACKHTEWVCSLFDCLFVITLGNDAFFHLLYLDRFIKMNSSSISIFWWRLNFLKIRLTSAEIRMSKLSKI